MKEMGHFDLEPTRFRKGIREMTPAQVGIYTHLIMLMYEEGKPLDQSHAWLARQCNTSQRTFKMILQSLLEMGRITDTPDGLWDETTEEKLNKCSQFAKKAQASAYVRWRKAQPNQANGHAVAMPAQCEGNATVTLTGTVLLEKEPKHTYDFDKKFEEFWGHYPKREGGNPKHPAKLKFITMVKQGADPDGIIQAAKSLALEHPVPTRFVPMAQTWLNQHRFEDTVDVVSNRSELEKAEEQARQRRLLAVSRRAEENMQ